METAGIIKSGELVPKKVWQEYIDHIKSEVNENSNKIDIKNAIIEAVKQRIPQKKFGIMFSGGVDSSLIALICKKLDADFICYSVGLENAADIPAAIKAAKSLKLELKYKVFTLDEIEEILQKLIPIVGTDIVALGVAAVEYAAIEMGKKDGIDTFFTGLGSEEIFAGYHRHTKSADVNEECWNGLTNAIWDRDFKRDFELGKATGICALTPFLDKNLITKAMGIDGKEKINKTDNKVILRQAAEELGLPTEIAWRKKIAAQYGSKFDRAILRLARRKNYDIKTEYINYLKDWL